MPDIIDIADKHLDKIKNWGQTDDEMARGRKLAQQLEQSDHVQEVKKVDNTSDTQRRNEVFNRLYNTVNKINQAGRKVFKNDPVNLAKFKSKWQRRGSSDNGGDEPDSDE